MPDWIIHMGASHALGRPLRGFDARWLLLGAVLPDVVPRGLGAIVHGLDLVDGFAAVELGLICSMWHTPFSAGLLCAALAVLATDRSSSVRGLLFGALMHLGLDALQRSVGGGVAFLFPVVLRPYALNLTWWDRPAVYALVAAFAVYLLVLVSRRTGPAAGPALTLRPGRCTVAALLLAVFAVTPFLRLDAAIELNLGNALLARDPRAFDGRSVGLGQVDVLDVVRGDGADAHVVVETGDVVLRVDWRDQPRVEVGDVVSVRGTLHGLVLEPDETAFVHNRGLKKAASLFGALLLVLLWWRPTRHRH